MKNKLDASHFTQLFPLFANKMNKTETIMSEDNENGEELRLDNSIGSSLKGNNEVFKQMRYIFNYIQQDKLKCDLPKQLFESMKIYHPLKEKYIIKFDDNSFYMFRKFENLNELHILSHALQFLYLIEQEKKEISMSPFPLLHDFRIKDFEVRQFLIIIPPEKQNGMKSENYYSSLIGSNYVGNIMISYRENVLIQKERQDYYGDTIENICKIKKIFDDLRIKAEKPLFEVSKLSIENLFRLSLISRILKSRIFLYENDSKEGVFGIIKLSKYFFPKLNLFILKNLNTSSKYLPKINYTLKSFYSTSII